MSRIRSRNTRPELIVRRFLWNKGYRYRLCDNRLPGRPDIVISKMKVAIFINGCFWHGHSSHKMRIPQSNADYWRNKIRNNMKRDLEVGIKLRGMGWTVITIWECELTSRKREDTLAKLYETMRMLGKWQYRRTELEDLSVAADPQNDYNPS